MSAADPDRRLLRRAARVIVVQTAIAVGATVLVVSALAYGLTVRREHLAQERAVRAAAIGTGVVTTGITVVEVDPAQTDAAHAPGAVDRTDRGGEEHGDGHGEEHGEEHGDDRGDEHGGRDHDLRLDQLPPGRSATRVGHRRYEVYSAVRSDGTRRVAVLDVTDRAESGERLLGSLVVAGLAGMVLAGMVAALVGNRAVRPLATALGLQRRFVADASHELRTPLAVLHTRAQLIQRRIGTGDRIDERTRAHIDRLVADTAALGDVVEDLLLSAELAHRAHNGEQIDLVALARDAVDSVTVHAEQAGARLDFVADVDQVLVSGVASALRRALLALVDNAVAHGGSGGVVTVGVSTDDATVRLWVADRGDGIDPADLGRLGTRFARGTRHGRGRRFGLGLALVGEVAAAHGGNLTVDSEPGVGSTFTICLPASGVPGGDPGPGPDDGA